VPVSAGAHLCAVSRHHQDAWHAFRISCSAASALCVNSILKAAFGVLLDVSSLLAVCMPYTWDR